jgi:hypothetical protein
MQDAGSGGPMDKPAMVCCAWALKLALLLAFILAVDRLGNWTVQEVELYRAVGSDTLPHRIVLIATIVYIVAMALPFCPGIEIGLALMLAFGTKVVPLVYAATVAALLLAFAIGRFIPAGAVIAIFERLHLRRASRLLLTLQPLGECERLASLLGHAPSRLSRWLLAHRYLAIAIALNTPGNVLVGDGGGIALAAGFSRLYSVGGFTATVILAVSPVPIAVLLLAS